MAATIAQTVSVEFGLNTIPSFIVNKDNKLASCCKIFDNDDGVYVYNNYTMYAQGDKVVVYLNSQHKNDLIEFVASGFVNMDIDGNVKFFVDNTFCFTSTPDITVSDVDILNVLNSGLHTMCNNAQIMIDTASFKDAQSNIDDKMNIVYKILSARHNI